MKKGGKRKSATGRTARARMEHGGEGTDDASRMHATRTAA
jgi:hypothetical protein